eukprot:9473166-Pyramimonas_sp.AAC.1
MLQVEDLDVALPVVLHPADRELPRGDKESWGGGLLTGSMTGQGQPKTRNQPKLIHPLPRSSAFHWAASAVKIKMLV